MIQTHHSVIRYFQDDGGGRWELRFDSKGMRPSEPEKATWSVWKGIGTGGKCIGFFDEKRDAMAALKEVAKEADQ